MTDHEPSRRQFIKKAAYVTPAILSLAAAPAYAKQGSVKEKIKDRLEVLKDKLENRSKP